MVDIHDAPPWREPVQARSRARVAAILEAARTLIVEKNTTEVKITEVAQRASIPVGSLYQFFPSRSALVYRLCELEMMPIDAALADGLSRVGTLDDLAAGVEKQMRNGLATVRARPCLIVLLNCAGTDPAIRAANFRNTNANAERLAKRLKTLVRHPSRAPAVEALALLICHLWSDVIRLCLMLEDERRSNEIVTQYAGMLSRHLAGLDRR
ncbi:TetR/AcrR family transcriptional regulator [Pontivivens ytuae]|uniref:TetR/AcrR family transcriptional regulator n=1 Tax=Pontivivens ytuae TaxID=2789856 RepID=A0A7S9LQS6_9RHOB|nr:TetR/AcrR family transcriptional regulator [Pontivivens ytuae]QPH53275.1 TetR/AcrR family transcriptional regulator [Pontivivens ytuae]